MKNTLYLLLFLVAISCKKKDTVTPQPINNQIQVIFSAQTINLTTVDSAVVFLSKANGETIQQNMTISGTDKLIAQVAVVPGEYDIAIRLYTNKLEFIDNRKRVHIYKSKITIPFTGTGLSINAPTNKLMDATWRPNLYQKDAAKGIYAIVAERQDDLFFEVKIPADFDLEFFQIDRYALDDNGDILYYKVVELFNKSEFVNGVLSDTTKFADYVNAVKSLPWTHTDGLIAVKPKGQPAAFLMYYLVENRP